ncbi:amidase [Photobacterium sanctipauli]|uniref:Amidase n=1 Tax=Photobacterium sanctipauli TaxID=1342794 RepID=A0A2T3NPR1_9GAMM|nr:L,D-transpeptidase family protein [Photobacterium sanctipauli]PSW18238.1 amidase [Photobacterium sanctipauli]
MSNLSRTTAKALGAMISFCSLSAGAMAGEGALPARLNVELVQLGSSASQYRASSGLICPRSVDQVCFADTLETIYATNGYLPLWQDPELRSALIVKLKSIAYAGLSEHLFKRIDELAQLANKRDQRGYDILATDSYLVYLSLQQQIQNQPSLLFRHQTLAPIETMDVSLNITSLTSPQALGYHLLSDAGQVEHAKRSMALAEKLSIIPPHSYQPTSRKLVKEGQVIPEADALLQVLNQYGDLRDEDYQLLQSQLEVTNSNEVNMAIRRFQQRNGLESDGILGPATIRQLSLPYQEVSRLIALNLQRSQLGASGIERPRIKVNIPDYQLQITHNDEVVFQSKVIVGRTTRPTNLFSSSVSTMVVNPRWNVPETIKKKDVIPGMKASPDYLANKNLKVIRSWRDRSEISPDMIEWSNVNPETFPYEFMQGPGPNNALGDVKFLMPNDYSVYLHDTPSRGLFNKTKRNLSSGCVRVEKAAELASYILDYQQRPTWRSYDQLVSHKKTDTIALPRKIDVDVTYVTAWVDENNQLQMREDIYGYDRPSRYTAKKKYSTLKNFRY